MSLPYSSDSVLLLLAALALLFTWLHHARVSRGNIPGFRPLAGVNDFARRAEELVEAGRPVHIATGASEPGAIGPTAASLASLTIVQRLAEVITRRGGRLIVTTGDITSLLAARGSLRQAYRRTGFAADYNAADAQLVAHQAPLPYAAGVASRYAVEPIDMSVVVGDYGAEALLIGEEGAERRIPQISGATTLSALPALALSTDAALIGEELFALEAYLSEEATPKARLLTHDALRWVVVLLIVLGVVYQIANLTLGLHLPVL